MKKLSILLIVLFSSLSSMSAQHKFGIRAGLNYSKFSGELETNEAYDFNTGFHFGFNYTYQLNTTIGFRTELLYTQRGSKQSIQDDAIYNVIRAIDGTTLVESLVVPLLIYCLHLLEEGLRSFKVETGLTRYDIHSDTIIITEQI